MNAIHFWACVRAQPPWGWGKAAAARSWNIHHPSTPLTERAEDLNFSLSHISPTLQHTLTHTQARLLLSNCKERRKRVHKYRNPLLFVWLCSWSHHSSHCTICRSMRTFLSPCTHQSAFAGGGGTTGSLGYLCDWHRASCSLSRQRISDGPAPTPSPPPPGDCGEIWKREERRGEQRNNSKAHSLKFFFLFPYWQDAHWSAGGSWLKGAEKGGFCIGGKWTNTRITFLCLPYQSAVLTSMVSYGRAFGVHVCVCVWGGISACNMQSSVNV